MMHVRAFLQTLILVGRLTFSAVTAAPPPDMLDLLRMSASALEGRGLCTYSGVAGRDRSQEAGPTSATTYVLTEC